MTDVNRPCGEMYWDDSKTFLDANVLPWVLLLEGPKDMGYISRVSNTKENKLRPDKVTFVLISHKKIGCSNCEFNYMM